MSKKDRKYRVGDLMGAMERDKFLRQEVLCLTMEDILWALLGRGNDGLELTQDQMEAVAQDFNETLQWRDHMNDCVQSTLRSWEDQDEEGMEDSIQS